MIKAVNQEKSSSVFTPNDPNRLAPTETLKSPKSLNQKVFQWLKEDPQRFTNKISPQELELLFTNKKDNPKTNLGLKRLLSKDSLTMKKILKEIIHDDFFLSILADQISELFIANKNLNLDPLRSFLLINTLEKFFSFRDPLTEVWNREALELIFEQEVTIDQESMNEHFYVFAFIDLNNFKQINETLSHDFGDQALIAFTQAVTEILAQQARKSDVFARWGGDEFAIVFQSNMPNDKADLTAIANRLTGIFKEIQTLYQKKLFSITNHTFDVAGFSVGLQTQVPTPRNSDGFLLAGYLNEYLSRAETAAKEAKQGKSHDNGGNGAYMVFAQAILNRLK